jgi:hypothetical protein
MIGQPAIEHVQLTFHLHGETVNRVLVLFGRVGDPDQVRIILRTLEAPRQQFLKQDSNLHAVGGGQGIQLQGVLAHRQGFLVRGPGDRPVDAGEFATAFSVPLPDPGWRVTGISPGISHSNLLWGQVYLGSSRIALFTWRRDRHRGA